MQTFESRGGKRITPRHHKIINNNTRELATRSQPRQAPKRHWEEVLQNGSLIFTVGYTHSLSSSRPLNNTMNAQSRAQQTHIADRDPCELISGLSGLVQRNNECRELFQHSRRGAKRGTAGHTTHTVGALCSGSINNNRREVATRSQTGQASKRQGGEVRRQPHWAYANRARLSRVGGCAHVVVQPLEPLYSQHATPCTPCTRCIPCTSTLARRIVGRDGRSGEENTPVELCSGLSLGSHADEACITVQGGLWSMYACRVEDASLVRVGSRVLQGAARVPLGC